MELAIPLNFHRAKLEVDGQTEVETTILHQHARINTLIKHSIACGYFGIAAEILREGYNIVGFTPYGESLQPRKAYRKLISETNSLELEVRTILDPTIRETLIVYPVE